MLTFCLCAVLLVAWTRPDTAVGRALRRLLIELPAERLGRLRLGAVILAVLFILAGAALVALWRQDGLALAAQTMPDGWALLATLDAASYIDAIALAGLLAATVRLRAIYTAARSAFVWMVRRFRALVRPASWARRQRRPRAVRPPRADDDGRPAPVFAYA